MNKRLKKKKRFKKVICYVKPLVHEDIDKCPIYKCFSMKKYVGLIDYVFKKYDSDICIKREYPFIRFGSQYDRELYG